MRNFEIGEKVNIDLENIDSSEDEMFLLNLKDKTLEIKSVASIDEELSYYYCSLNGSELMFEFVDADLIK